MDLDEMLRVDRCLDMDELINILSQIRIIFRMPEPDCFLRYHALQRGILLRRKNPTYRYFAAVTRGFKMVLWPNTAATGGQCFYSPRAVRTTLSEVHALYQVPFQFVLLLLDLQTAIFVNVKVTMYLKSWITF